MKIKLFTIVELLVAVGVMMILSSALAYTYTSTAQLTSQQMAISAMNTDASHLLDLIGREIKSIRLIDNDLKRIQMMGSYLEKQTMNLGYRGTSYLTFVNVFQELAYDKNLLARDSGAGGVYNGIANNNFKTSEGLKEVAFYTIFNSKEGFYDAYRAIRSPINSPESLANPNQQVLKQKKIKNAYKITNNIVYLGFRFWDGNSDADTYNKTDFPIVVDVTLSMAASTGPGQWEGMILPGSSAKKLVIKKENGTFPPASMDPDGIGYILIDNGKEENIFEYNTVQIVNGNYVFNNHNDGKAGGLVPPNIQVGDTVIVGQTFRRSFNLR